MSLKVIQQRFIFKGLPYIICDIDNILHQLPNCPNKKTKPYRVIKEYLNNGSIGYRINGRYYSKRVLKEKAVKNDKIINVYI